LETGSHVGIGASYLGMGLRDNNRGHLDSVEFLPEIHKQAVSRIKTMGLEYFVSLYLQDAKDFKPEDTFDLILLDTEPQTRFGEFVKFYPYLKEGGFVFIHDLHRHMHQIPNVEHGFAWPFGLIPDFMVNLIHDGKVRPFHFSTPRGLTGFYKVSSQDYKFTK
jgi:predicted O-methyltransferase YrrM